MNLLHSIEPLYTATGFIVGLLVGMTGVGGGSLMTPLLIILFGIHPATAVGTDLLYAAATKSGGSLVHGLNRTIDWRVVGCLSSGSVPTTILTLLAFTWVDLKGPTGQLVITTVLTGALLLTAVTLLYRDRITSRYAARLEALSRRDTIALTIVVGAVLGALVSISSVGAGAIGATALIILYPRLPIARVVGSDIAHAVPLTLVAGVGHWMLGSIDWSILGSLLIGSLPGIFLGSYAVLRVPDTAMRIILAGMLIFVAGNLSFGSHSPERSTIASTAVQASH